MRFSLEKFEDLDIGWNERPLTEDDFHKLCRDLDITVTEEPLSISGFYYCLMGRHFIVINSALALRDKLFVMFHELAHFIVHSPKAITAVQYHCVGRKTRAEQEADIFASIALIPRRWLETKTLDELIRDEGISGAELRERFGFLERHGV